jgi:hypothetical protein
VTAPTITELPALPTFPPGPGLPDQPGVFIPAFLAFLDALRNWRTDLVAFGEFVENNGSTSTSSTRWNVITETSNARTISSADIGAHVRFTSDTSVTLIIPVDHGFSAGDCVRFTQAGDGRVGISRGSSGVTLLSLDGAVVSRGAGAEWEMVCVGGNAFDLFGDIESEVILLSGDMTDGDDVVLFSGDMTDGDDQEQVGGV